MDIDLNWPAVGPDGDYRGEESHAYRKRLMSRFEESKEGRELAKRGGDPSWADIMMDFRFDYDGGSLAAMDPADVDEILFGVFPRKVSAPPEDAPGILDTVRQFWRFLKREFSAKNADEIIEALDDDAVVDMQREMADPSNFGMAKSFFTQGQALGFDLESEAGLQEWVRAVNAATALSGAENSAVSVPSSIRPKTAKTKSKAKRRLRKKSRTRNRR